MCDLALNVSCLETSMQLVYVKVYLVEETTLNKYQSNYQKIRCLTSWTVDICFIVNFLSMIITWVRPTLVSFCAET